jgi:LVIVD repeat-containing protein
MKNLLIVGLLLAAIVCSNCSREFTPPAPRATISDFSPDHGFMGDAVGICGEHFDNESGSNIVYFGTAVAEIIEDGRPDDAKPDSDYECKDNEIWVRVPELGERGPQSIIVATSTGQVDSETDFVYEGPGHPINELLKKTLDFRSGLWAVFQPPGANSPAFGTIGVESSVLGIFEEQRGLHLDFGVCGLPLSGAAGVVSFTEFVVVCTRMDFNQADLGINTNIFSWKVNLLDVIDLIFAEPQMLDLPPTSDVRPFVPNLVWSYPSPVQTQVWVEPDFAVSHLRQPALAIAPADDLAAVTVVELPDQAPHCNKNDQEKLGPIADLAYDEVSKQIYVALADSNEIWRIDAVAPHVTRRMFPPPDQVGYDGINCNFKNAALAVRNTHPVPASFRLYVSDQASLSVQVMKLAGEAPNEYLTPIPLQMLILDSIPYAMQTAKYPSLAESGLDIAGERLYVASQTGLTIVDVSDKTPLNLIDQIPFRLVGKIPMPVNRGGTQSIAVNTKYGPLTPNNPDEVLFVDAANERVVTFFAGQEDIFLSDTPVGATVPQVATSYQSDRLYLSNSLSNAIHLVDRNTGLRTDQFPIAPMAKHGTMGFGSYGMTTWRMPGGDLLIAPLSDGKWLTAEEGIQYRQLAFGHISDESPACGLTTGGLEVDDGLTEKFEQMQLVSWDIDERQDVPVLVLTRYFDQVSDPVGVPQPILGDTYCVEIDPNGTAATGIVKDSLALCANQHLRDLGPGVRAVRASKNFQLIAVLEEDPAGGVDASLGIRLINLQSGNDALTTMDAELAQRLADVLVTQRATFNGQVGQVYLGMGELGLILVTTYQADGEVSKHVIETGGDPTFLSLSPDGRRLYVSHFFSGQVSVIDTDCHPVGQCEAVVATIEVDAWPGPIVFDDTGETAYVLHFTSSDISWIE